MTPLLENALLIVLHILVLNILMRRKKIWIVFLHVGLLISAFMLTAQPGYGLLLHLAMGHQVATAVAHRREQVALPLVSLDLRLLLGNACENLTDNIPCFLWVVKDAVGQLAHFFAVLPIELFQLALVATFHHIHTIKTGNLSIFNLASAKKHPAASCGVSQQLVWVL